jgi:hypothetical protein
VGKGESFSLSHTIGTGSSRALYVFVQLMDTSASKDIGTAEFNGNSMTEIVNTGLDVKAQVFRLTAPTSGSGTVSLKVGQKRGQGQGPENKAGIGVISFENVDQGTPEGPVSTAASQGSSSTLTGIATTQVDHVVDAIATDKSINGPGTNQIDQWRAAAESGKQAGGSTADVSGSTDMAWTFVSGKYTHVGFNINNSC